MTNRQQRILAGCKWMLGIVAMNKTDSDLFKRAARTLSDLLRQEADGVVEDELYEAAKKLFVEDTKDTVDNANS